MRNFDNIAELIKKYREKCRFSQEELSIKLGYKRGIFITNVENKLCTIPHKLLRQIIEILQIPPEELMNAILLDSKTTMERYIFGPRKRHDAREIL